MGGETILTVTDVCKYFVRNGQRVDANHHVSLHLNQGEVLGIVGESGSGKSTLAKLLMDIQRPDCGVIQLCGQEFSKLTPKETKLARKNIQMIFQNPLGSMNPKKRVKDIICEPLLNYGLIKGKDVREQAARLLHSVMLDESFLDKYPHSMSGGQAQRVAIARAIALKPKVLLCDEATSALDVSVQKSIVDTLIQLNRQEGISIIFISHDIYLTKFIADRIVVMYQGEVVETLDKGDYERPDHAPYTLKLMESARVLNDKLLCT